MTIQKEKTYLVLNYCSHPVSISTRYDSFILDACKSGEPTSLPLSIDEIQQVNNSSKVFKTGHLRFEPEFEKEIYELLRIRDWEKILTTKQIEAIILNPTKETLEEIIGIEEPRYFNRIYGVYMGMRNAGFSISKNVDIAMTQRYKELVNKKYKTRLIFNKKDDVENNDISQLKEENESIKTQNQKMQSELEEMREMMKQFQSMISNVPKQDEKALEVVEKKATPKTTAKATNSTKTTKTKE